MITALESPDSVTTQSEKVTEPSIHEQRKSDCAPQIVCDLANARFCTDHLPILAAFGLGHLHECKLAGSWDLERAVSENADALVRSSRILNPKRPEDDPSGWEDLTFRFGPHSFLYANSRLGIAGFASSASEAKRLVTKFDKAYTKPSAPHGSFNLIQLEVHGITCHNVALPPDTILDDETINLHYGSGSAQWHQGFVRNLCEYQHGLTILEGSPGTGKTFYLRHLIRVLKESHRFYFIPTATLGILSKPDFIGFWAEQRRRYSKWQFVVILEDADAALMTRGADNREQVSAILNLSDGLLADFLHLQIICTINCATADIDQALLRPGRLLSHRVFPRLDYGQALRLAESLGRKLPIPGDYSLAEVFSGQEKQERKLAHMGFDA